MKNIFNKNEKSDWMYKSGNNLAAKISFNND